MASILFVCTGNMYRSPLAAAFFRVRLAVDGKLGWNVQSAGTWTQPGQPLPDETARASAKLGVRIENHLTQVVNEKLLASSDVVIVMEKGHKEALDHEFPFSTSRTHLISSLADGLIYDVKDPMQSGQDLNTLAADLYAIVERAYPNICRLVEEKRTPSSTS